jgi:dihydroorotase
VDVLGGRLRGTLKLACELTLRDGRVVYNLDGISRIDWNKLRTYGPQGDASWDGTIDPGLRAPKK